MARALAATAAPDLVGALNPTKVMSADDLWAWQNFMVDLGPRFTGSTQHVKYLQFIEAEAHAAGLTTFHDEPRIFPRWDADYTQCRITLLGNSGSESIEVMSYFPGSGNTAGAARQQAFRFPRLVERVLTR